MAVSGGADSKIYAQSGNWEEEISEISTVKDLSQDTGFIEWVFKCLLLIEVFKLNNTNKYLVRLTRSRWMEIISPLGEMIVVC